MNRPQTSSDDWQPCEPGTLQRLADRQRRGRRIAATKRIAAPVAAVALLFVVGLSFTRRDQPAHQPHGGLSCAEFARHIHAYAENQVDATLAGQMHQHALDCPRCQQKLDALRDAAATRFPAAAPGLPLPLGPITDGGRDLLALTESR